MKIIDLTPEYENTYFCCLEEWSDEIREAGDHKACWYAKMKNHGLRVKLAQDDKGEIGGMIQYLPVENSTVEGHHLYCVLCIWVHGNKQGRGNFQKRGMGKSLLKAAEEDAKKLGAKGLVTWGIILPFFMRAGWFKKQGYRVADKTGIMRLLWKPFAEDAEPPKFMKARKLPDLVPGKVNVTVFINGWCPAQNLVYERTKKAIFDFGEKIVFDVYRTIDHEILSFWVISDALYVQGKQIWTGPPPSYAKIRRIIEKQIARLN
jgi:GNAT superfamily N-acetyltransferase